MPVEVRTCDWYCKGCIYRGGQSGLIKCCNYYLITNKRRPCPAGDGCTVRRLRKQTGGDETGKKSTGGFCD